MNTKALQTCFLIAMTSTIACNNTTTAPVASTPPNHPEVHNNGVNIVYTDTGSGDTTLLFVHGWGINKSYWSNQVEHFQSRYRVVTMDLPGFGASGTNRNTWDTRAYGSDVDSVIAQLGLKNVVLIGHSMAGNIVVQAAVQSPGKVIGLVGVDNFKNMGQPVTPEAKKQFEQAIEAMKHHFYDVASQYFNQALFYTTTADSIRKRILNDVAHTDSTIAVAAMQQDGFDEVQQLTAAHKKLYLINSDVTPTDTSGFAAHHIPVEVLPVHATGHYPMIEKPREFNDLLSSALAGIQAGK